MVEIMMIRRAIRKAARPLWEKLSRWRNRRAIATLFNSSLADPESAQWQILYERLLANSNQFAVDRLSADVAARMLSLLLLPVGRIGFRDGETFEKLFDLAETQRVHILPVSFQHPVPEVSRLDDALWSHRFDRVVKLDPEAQLSLLDRLKKWGDEMASTPATEVEAARSEYRWLNPSFGPLDAVIYHAMIREFRPKRIIEVGAGYSTMIAARAARINGQTRVECIEPYPMKILTEGFEGFSRLIASPLQSVPMEEFESLEADDILFIDSSHVSKIGSDVNRLFFEILPRLRPGVIIHLHDIFFPWDYPQGWVKEKKIFWNEQYLLMAFLMFNDEFEILLANNYLRIEHGEKLQQAFPFLPALSRGASFWMRRCR